jgi:hypothetical protein
MLNVMCGENKEFSMHSVLMYLVSKNKIKQNLKNNYIRFLNVCSLEIAQ